MLVIKKEVDLAILKKYGFKKEPEHQYYYKKLFSDVEIEIQITKNDLDFKPREIGINVAHGIYINEIDILYDLIKDGLIERRKK